MASYKEKFENYTAMPDPEVWQGIEHSLKVRAQRRRAAIYASAAAAVVAASVAFIVLRAPSDTVAMSSPTSKSVPYVAQSHTDKSLTADNQTSKSDMPTSLPEAVASDNSQLPVSNKKVAENTDILAKANNYTAPQPVLINDVSTHSSQLFENRPTAQQPANNSMTEIQSPSIHQHEVSAESVVPDNVDSESTTASRVKSPVSDSLVVWIPNAFSPDDPINDNVRTFKVVPNSNATILSFEIYIYSRTGRLVYHSKDINEGWDGTSRGHAQPVGTYVYVIEINDAVRGLQHARGNITLLR